MGWERPWGYLEIAGAKFSPVLYVMMNSGIYLSHLNFFLYLYFFIVFHVRLFNLISSFFSLFLEIFDDTVNFIHRMRSVQITIMYALRLLLNIYENISHIFQ